MDPPGDSITFPTRGSVAVLLPINADPEINPKQ
jgi:hypothetical protein